MQAENFDFDKARELFEAEPTIKIGKKEIRKVSQATKDYLSQYFFQTKINKYYFWDADKQDFTILKKDEIKDVYFEKLSYEINQWFFKENTKLYNIITAVHKPRIQGNELNLFYGLMHSKYKRFDEYDKTIRDNVELFLSYMKELLCSHNKQSYEYLIKWIANVCRGNKNDGCLYLKGPEGIGKSTLSDFLREYVFGFHITTSSPAEPLTTSFNKLLLGKLLVVFEELPNFGNREWEGISSKLKSLITGNKCIYADKMEKAFESDNINNYIINTNVNAIQHSEGRRYYILDLSTRRKDDYKYFGNIKAKCFNNKVGEAFFAYMMEVNVEGFNAQKDMPESQKKRDAIAERLDPVYQFIKEKYILRDCGIRCSVATLFNEYNAFVQKRNKIMLGKIKFCAKLSEVQINYKKSNGKTVFNYSYNELKAIAEKNKWLHELDEVEEDDEDLFEEKEVLDNLDRNDKVSDKDRMIKELQKEIKRLKKAEENRIMKKITEFLEKHRQQKKQQQEEDDEEDEEEAIVSKDVDEIMDLFD